MRNGTKIIFMDTKRAEVSILPSLESKLLKLIGEGKQIQSNGRIKREEIQNR